MKQVGRNVIFENRRKSKYETKLSAIRALKLYYYKLRIKMIERRKTKYSKYAGGYQLDLFNSYVYLEQSYLYKIEALYSLQEIRYFERRVKRSSL